MTFWTVLTSYQIKTTWIVSTVKLRVRIPWATFLQYYPVLYSDVPCEAVPVSRPKGPYKMSRKMSVSILKLNSNTPETLTVWGTALSYPPAVFYRLHCMILCIFFIYHVFTFWCRIHLSFRSMGGLRAKSMTSQRNRQIQDGGYSLLRQRYDNNKMAAICYYGNVMSTTRWRLCFFYIFNSTVIDWTCYMFFLLVFPLTRGRDALRFF